MSDTHRPSPRAARHLRAKPPRARRRERPDLEGLEDRRLMAVAFQTFQFAQSVGGNEGTTTNVMFGLAPASGGFLNFTYDNPMGTPQGPKIGRISEADGSFSSFTPDPNAGPAGISTGPGVLTTYADRLLNQLGVINVNATGLTNTIPTTESPTAITQDNLSNLWFTEGNLTGNGSEFDMIGKLSGGTGPIQYFRLPTPEPAGFDSSESIVDDALDNSVWFTEPLNNKIGKIAENTDIITEFDVPTTNANPTSITLGPDAALWFTETPVGKIGRIDPSGNVTEFSLPAGSRPTSIVTGPQNDLWVTDAGNDKLIELSSDGTIVGETTISGATAMNSPANLIAPNSGLWFTLSQGYILKATFTATPTPTPIPTPAPTPTPNPPSTPTPTPVTTTMKVNVAQPSTVLGVGMTATIAAASGVAPTTGTVDFVDKTTGQELGAESVSNGQASLVVNGLSAGTHVIVASFGNAQGYATSQDLFDVRVAKETTSTRLVASPTSASDGQTVKLTATVTPQLAATALRTAAHAALGVRPLVSQVPAVTGTVTFYEGTHVLRTVQVNSQGVATVSFSAGPPGLQTFTAIYSGDANFVGSTSNPAQVNVAPPVGTDGPRVAAVQRYGYHAMPTTLVVFFNAPMGLNSVTNTANYLITGPGGGTIGVVAALYNSVDHSVTLAPAARLNLHDRYTLTIVGTGPNGVRSATGLLLDGANTGKPGSNAVLPIDASNLVVTDPHAPGAAAALSVAAKARAADARARF